MLRQEDVAATIPACSYLRRRMRHPNVGPQIVAQRRIFRDEASKSHGDIGRRQSQLYPGRYPVKPRCHLRRYARRIDVAATSPTAWTIDAANGEYFARTYRTTAAARDGPPPKSTVAGEGPIMRCCRCDRPETANRVGPQSPKRRTTVLARRRLLAGNVAVSITLLKEYRRNSPFPCMCPPPHRLPTAVHGNRVRHLPFTPEPLVTTGAHRLGRVLGQRKVAATANRSLGNGSQRCASKLAVP